MRETIQTTMLNVVVAINKPMDEWTAQDNERAEQEILRAKAEGRVAKFPWPNLPGSIVNVYVADGEPQFTLRLTDGRLVNRASKFCRVLTVTEAITLGWK